MRDNRGDHRFINRVINLRGDSMAQSDAKCDHFSSVPD